MLKDKTGEAALRMSGIEVFVVKALISPVLSSGGKAASKRLFGDDDKNALVKLCREALDEALDLSLRLFQTVDDNYKNHLRAVLEEALGTAAEPLGAVDLLRSDGLTKALERVDASAIVDWSTFGVPSDEGLIPLDYRTILTDFLDGLLVKLRDAASRNGSPVSNLADRLDFEEIRSALAAISRLLESQALSGMPLDRTASLDQAIARQTAAISWRHYADVAGDTYVESTAITEWAEWVNRDPWTTQITSSISDLVETLKSLGIADHGLGVAAARLRSERSRCSSILVQLRRLNLDQAMRDLERALRSSDERPADFDARTFHEALTTIRRLQEQCRSPHFDACFAISGRFGAGRSRTLTRIAELAERRSDLSLFLSLRAGESIRVSLTHQSGQLLRREFAELSELAQFLGDETRHPRMFLLVDDLDVVARENPDLLTELQAVIDESTAWPGLHWCLSIDADQLDAVISNSDPYFWVKFGTAAKSVTDTGWLDLDELNSRQQLGLALLAELAERPDRADIEELMDHPRGFAYEHEHLSRPLAAWMMSKALDDAKRRAPATDVNNPAFVREYWKWIQEQLGAQADNEGLEATVTGLARAFADAGVPMIRVAPDASAGFAEEWIETGVQLRTLRKAGLITLTWQGDPEVEFRTQYAVANFPAFWGYRIARTLVHDACNPNEDEAVVRLQDAVKPWWVRFGTNEGLAEATCQFVLTVSDEFAPNAAGELWKAWASQSTAPRVPLIMAATGNTAARQQTVIDLVCKPNYKPISKRELFITLRLIGRCDLETWPADQRLEVANRHFIAIAEAGLDTYLHQVLRSVLKDPELIERK